MSELTAIYVHVPFCVKKCAYCDFYSIVDISLKERFVTWLKGEICLRKVAGATIDTIYFGGGTPSLLSPDQIGVILGCIFENFFVSKECEITLEANPGTVNSSYFKKIRDLGVNRLNIGVQSFFDEKLDFMGRIHSAAIAEYALDQARKAGFDNLGFDLIYGLPGETQESWIKDLDRAIEFGPEHLSCYMLTYEPGTPMYHSLEQGLVKPLDDGVVASLFKLTSTYLANHGYLHYEISNFAADSNFLTDYRSKHNQKYWNHVPYLGFGPSAHSFYRGVRSWNVADIGRYMDDLAAGVLPVADSEILTRTQMMIETVMLGLRTSEGVDLREFKGLKKQAVMEGLHGFIIDCKKNSWAVIVNDRFVLTLEGRLFLDHIVAAFAEFLQDL